MASPITISIKDEGNRIELPWQPDMDIQKALELAYDQEKAAGRKFSFALQFFGTELGYMIIMMDGMLDNPNDPNDPYWWFLINGQSASVGIDDYIVQPGDSLEFDYTPFDPDKHGASGANAKKAKAYFNA